MRIRNVLTSTAAALALTACASAPQSTSTTTSNEPTTPLWTGSLQPTQQRTGAMTVTGQTRAFGTVRIAPAEGSNFQRMHVALTVGLPVSAAQSVRWAVLPDRCGSGDLPVIGFEQFPLIEISTNGRGQIDVDLPLTLTSNAAYHVNVYSGGQQLDNVVTCANLKREEGTSH